jgi:hypothetical protein
MIEKRRGEKRALREEIRRKIKEAWEIKKEGMTPKKDTPWKNRDTGEEKG